MERCTCLHRRAVLAASAALELKAEPPHFTAAAAPCAQSLGGQIAAEAKAEAGKVGKDLLEDAKKEAACMSQDLKVGQARVARRSQRV